MGYILSLKWLNWPFFLKKCSIFAYFRRELETSFFGEDGKCSPILDILDFFNLTESERKISMERQFRADVLRRPSLRCSKCNKEYRRNLYEDFHWCKVTKRGRSRHRKIQICWEPELAGSSTPSNDQETMTSCQPNARWVTTCVICLVNYLIESLHALQPGRDWDWENIVQVSP
jgi:hypothetical protein